MQMIKIINSAEREKIFDTSKPIGIFLIIESSGFTGIDNTTGDAWTEDFKDLSKCLRWLHGEDLEVLEGECDGV
jgi:hypothetical protein